MTFEQFTLMIGPFITDQNFEPELQEAFLVFQKGHEDASITAEDLAFMMGKFGFKTTKEDA
jgi:Ca2+-binding EF-hand superfamily protein